MSYTVQGETLACDDLGYLLEANFPTRPSRPSRRRTVSRSPKRTGR